MCWRAVKQKPNQTKTFCDHALLRSGYSRNKSHGIGGMHLFTPKPIDKDFFSDSVPLDLGISLCALKTFCTPFPGHSRPFYLPTFPPSYLYLPLSTLLYLVSSALPTLFPLFPENVSLSHNFSMVKNTFRKCNPLDFKLYEQRHEKTCFYHMRTHSCRSACASAQSDQLQISLWLAPLLILRLYNTYTS